MSLLLVYGTLQRNQRNHWRLFGSRYLGKAYVYGELFQFPMFNFPILRRSNRHLVHGELYEVNRAVVEINDAEEVWYKRVRREAFFEPGQNKGLAPVSCWVYEGLDCLPLNTFARRLPAGKWPAQ